MVRMMSVPRKLCVVCGRIAKYFYDGRIDYNHGKLLNIGIRHTRIGKYGGRISSIEIGCIGLSIDDKLIAIISSKIGVVGIV